MTALWMDVPSVEFLPLSSRIAQDLAQPRSYGHNSLSRKWFAEGVVRSTKVDKLWQPSYRQGALR
jgi:hypothetical protein